MNGKYYIPEIEEFHPGFEIQWNIVDVFTSIEDVHEAGLKRKDVTEPKSKYSEYRYERERWENIVWDEDFSFPNHTDTKYRVKYLDQEDIESLGFNMNPINNRVFSKKSESAKEFYINTGWSSPVTDKISTVITNIIRDDNMRIKHEHFLFNGIIKNKSELKRILKQIGV